MRRNVLAALLLGVLMAACVGPAEVSAPGTGEVWIKHRVPSK